MKRIDTKTLILIGIWVIIIAVVARDCLGSSMIAAAPQSDSIKTMIAVRVQSPPKIDGRLDDAVWKQAVPTSGFVQMLPEEGKLATEQTVVRVLYDEHNLYFGIECLDSHPEGIEARLVPRDGSFYPADLVGIVLDTYHDHQNCFGFWTNPHGVLTDFQSDGDGCKEWWGINLAWDGIWQVEGRITAKGWEVEIVIPFKTLRFPRKRVQVWGVNLQRYQKAKREDTAWSPITRSDVSVLKVSRAGHLVGLENLKQGFHLEILPYTTAKSEQRDFEARPEWDKDLGVDIKYGITSNLTADLTLNPDFAQVEADEEQINLTRFELFYPEKRPFFIEGKDLFTPMGLFYSRRIRNPNFGAKTTGKLGSYSLGFLSAVDVVQEERNPIFNVLRLQRDILGNSSVGVLGVERHSSRHEYAGAVGVDVRLRPWNIYEFNLDAARSFNPGVRKNDWKTSVEFGRHGRSFSFWGWLNSIEPEFSVDRTGYAPHDPHIGERELGLWMGYDYWRGDKAWEELWLGQFFKISKRSDDWKRGWTWENFDFGLSFRDYGHFGIWHRDWYMRYQRRGYRGQTWGFAIEGRSEKMIRPEIGFKLEDHYDWGDKYFGKIKNLWYEVKIKPSDNLTFDLIGSVVWEYFPSGELDEIKRVGNFRLTFLPTRDIFFRVFVPLNLTADQYAVNALISYRYRPLSRIYLAYNQIWGQKEEKIRMKDRIVVLKISYLWNF